MFTATRLQIATYLLGVCPFSIAFLVFLNSSVSFVITDLIGTQKNVGDAVGSLGFADELVALVACPFWGLLSDRIGVRYVCILGYGIICLALILFVQTQNVYPQLLLGRLFFSIGGAAASTMVTAILPTMTHIDDNDSKTSKPGVHTHQACSSINSELTITPARIQSASSSNNSNIRLAENPEQLFRSTSRIAGFVGMFTGCGALIALVIFLPLPARFQKAGTSPATAIKHSYYVVAIVAFLLVIWCFFGLRHLQGEDGGKEQGNQSDQPHILAMVQGRKSALQNLKNAFLAGFQRSDIALGYSGGFVARASSVGISLFIPLLVNTLFLSSDLCKTQKVFDNLDTLPDIKRKCPRAYVVAAELTGVSQMVALISAPIFGYISGSTSRKGLPMMVASIAGIIGYPLFVTYFNPDDTDKQSRAIAFFAVCLIGISQIGAIVCSLGVLSSGVLSKTQEKLKTSTQADSDVNGNVNEQTNLLGYQSREHSVPNSSTLPKGSVAGVYSLFGGFAILILTKVGGLLFDKVSVGAPFYIMAGFNGVLMLMCGFLGLSKSNHQTAATNSSIPED